MCRALRPHCLSCEGLDTTSSTQAHEGRGLRNRIRGLRVCSTFQPKIKTEKGKGRMSTATVPLPGGVPPELFSPLWTGVGDLLDAAPSAGLDLPCRSSDNPDLWFAD